MVTGHYARVEYEESSGRYLLKKAADQTKDQSYVLYSLTQDQLAHVQFPLGGMTKNEVREVAEAHGFVNAKKAESQDICFVQNGKYHDFIAEYTGKEYPEGDFVDTKGNVLGRHKGIIRYTVGQRKGLGIAFGEPMYVLRIDPAANTVVLGTNDELFTDTVTARGINLFPERISGNPCGEGEGSVTGTGNSGRRLCRRTRILCRWCLTSRRERLPPDRLWSCTMAILLLEAAPLFRAWSNPVPAGNRISDREENAVF